MRISFSALDTYTTCPQKYKFQEIDKIKGPKSKEALFGTAIHEALKFMFSRDPLFPTSEEVTAHFRENFTSIQSISDSNKTRYLESGEKMLKDFYTKNPPWTFRVVDLESRFEAIIDDPVYSTSHTLVGSIDRIDKRDDETFEIIDYKTSRKLPSQETVDNNMQLAIYQIGLRKRWPHIQPEQIKLTLYFVKSNEKLSTTRNAETLAGTETKILSRLHVIEEKTKIGDFPPTPSALCEWCPYKQMCPAWSHLYKKPEEKIEIEKVVHEYFVLKSEIDERKRRLAMISGSIRSYLEVEKLDRIFGANGTISLSAQEHTGWDSEKIKTILEGNPILNDLLSIDTKKIKKVFDRLPYPTQEQLKNEARIVKKFVMLKASKKIEKTSAE
ncbi:MAG: PD-(D/E)XK nuclease family protein [Patescibacteria group bacterium]